MASEGKTGFASGTFIYSEACVKQPVKGMENGKVLGWLLDIGLGGFREVKSLATGHEGLIQV